MLLGKYTKTRKEKHYKDLSPVQNTLFVAVPQYGTKSED